MSTYHNSNFTSFSGYYVVFIWTTLGPFHSSFTNIFRASRTEKGVSTKLEPLSLITMLKQGKTDHGKEFFGVKYARLNKNNANKTTYQMFAVQYPSN